MGNLSGVKGVGSGVFEHRIDFGPSHRIYFGKDGEVLVILLGGGTKRCQRQGIETALDEFKTHLRSAGRPSIRRFVQGTQVSS